MEYLVSPNFSHKKLESPSINDLVDVFEDLWINCVFVPVEILLKAPNGDIAAITILCSYFESIAGYISGSDTSSGSKKFFVDGFCRVFSSDSSGIQKAAGEIYKYVRCGLAHEGMLSHKVNYSRLGAKPFLLTYRYTTDGALDIASGAVSIMVNPERMYKGVRKHFDAYVTSLRRGDDPHILEAFERTIQKQWALGAGENPVGMTEAQFLGRVV